MCSMSRVVCLDELFSTILDLASHIHIGLSFILGDGVVVSDGVSLVV